MVCITMSDSYSDNNGNQINGELRNCKVIFKGKNAKLTLGRNFHPLGQNCTIVMEDDCEASFGDNFQMGSNEVFYFRSNSFFSIGANASWGNNIRLLNKGKITIGDRFCIREEGDVRIHGKLVFDDCVYIQHHVVIYVPRHTTFKAGKDSGISWYSKIIAGSGHSIFDLKHKIKVEEMNPNSSPEKTIEFGQHVWIGCGSTIYCDCKIGDGSIVASNSCVWAGTYGPRVMIAGNPAKKIADNVTWDRRVDLSFEEFVDYDKIGEMLVERPAFFEEYSDQGVDETYYYKAKGHETV